MKNIHYIILLIIIWILTHLPWFNFDNVLFHSDRTHRSNLATKEILQWLRSGRLSFANFWSTNQQYNFILFKIIRWLMWDYEIGTKITFFIPIALLWFLSPYILVRNIIKNNFLAFIGAILYGTNTYLIVRQTSHLPIAFIFALMPLILFFFKKLISEDFSWRNILYFIFIFSIWLGYEVRIMYIVSFILFIYLLIIDYKQFYYKKFWYKIWNILLWILFLNFYWIIPTVIWSQEIIAETANRWLFGNFLFNIHYALNWFDSSRRRWLPDQTFTIQPIPILFWIYPFIIILWLINLRINKHKSFFIFWFILYLIWALITTQSSEPFPKLYLWLYNNFPWFSLFREASKFYIITWLSFLILIPNILLSIKNKKLKNILQIAIIVLSAYISIPLINWTIWTLWIDRWDEPTNYKSLNEFISKQKETFKVLWLPQWSQRSSFSIKHPKVSLVSEIDKSTFQWKKRISYFDRNYNDYASFMTKVIDKNTLSKLWIKYIVVPEYDDRVIVSYGSSWYEYVSKLDKIEFLEKINIAWITNSINIYENSNYFPLLSSMNSVSMLWKQINPTKYLVKLKISNNTNIDLLQNFENNRKLYPWTFSDINCDEDDKVVYSWDVTECTSDHYKFFQWEELSYLWKVPVFDNTHKIVNEYANGWTIDRRYILQHFPKDSYIINPDWSIDVKLILYFRPQSWFYIWLGISGLTFLWLILWLIWDSLKKKKQNSWFTNKSIAQHLEKGE